MKNTYRKINGFLVILYILNSPLFINDCMSQWVLVGNGLANTTFYSLAANSNTIFAGGGISNSNVYLSTNNGTNWTSTLTLNASFYSLAANGNNIFAGSDGQGVFYSSNNGTSWTPSSLNSQTIGALAVNGNFVFAGAYGVYRSSNNGANWTQTPLNNRSVLSLAVKGDTVYAGTLTYGVYISTDNGTNWTQTSLNNRWVLSLAVRGVTIFAGTSGTGVWISTDNGTTWTQSSLTGYSVNSLAMYGINIFAGTYGAGFYASTDNGASWTPRNEGLGGMFVRALCITNNYIFACPDTRVYRRLLSDLTAIEPVSNEIPKQFSLSQNYPNPFNPATKINFSLPVSSGVKLVVYDIQGKEVEVLVNETMNAGVYEVDWNASALSSGTYFYTIKTENYTETKKMILVK